MTRTLPLALLALLALLLLPSAADAADLPLAAGGYWTQFQDYWIGRFRQQSGMVLAVLAVGAVGIAIIVFGNKWKS